MTARFVISAALVLIAAGYLVMQFGVLVLDDASADQEAGQDAGHDADTIEWLRQLREPVVVTPADASGLDDLLIDLMTSDLQLRGHIPSQRHPGGAS